MHLAEEAARHLAALLSSSARWRVLQQLQQATPAPASNTQQQQQQMVESCCTPLQQLHAALMGPVSGAAAARQLLRSALGQQAARSAGTLLAWLLQRAQQLAAAQPFTDHLQELFSLVCGVLQALCRSGVVDEDGSSLPSAVAITQQLEQSGESG
jgi:hypothetical protein